MEATKLEALRLVMRQLLQSEYGLDGVHVIELRSDAKGVFGLRTACEDLAKPDAKQWMSEMVFSIAENLEAVSMQSPQPRFAEHQVMEMVCERYGGQWGMDDDDT